MSEWISVKSSFPDQGLSVLISNGKNIGQAYFLGICWKVVASNDRVDVSDVTHWMPLPELPK
jgi:hypothetical protein